VAKIWREIESTRNYTWQRFGGSILPRGIGDQKDDIMASAVARSAEIVIDFDNIISHNRNNYQRFTIIFK